MNIIMVSNYTSHTKTLNTQAYKLQGEAVK